jgi:hypothetical protein
MQSPQWIILSKRNLMYNKISLNALKTLHFMEQGMQLQALKFASSVEYECRNL